MRGDQAGADEADPRLDPAFLPCVGQGAMGADGAEDDRGPAKKPRPGGRENLTALLPRQPVEDRDDIRTTVEEDRAQESAVLQHVLALHPTAITIEELVRELDPGRDSFAQRDAVERAVRDLAGSGLLYQGESLVRPTRAALRFDELLG